MASQKVGFTQPDKTVQSFTSANVEGYTVAKGEDGKWSATGPDGFEQTGLEGRKQAMEAVQARVDSLAPADTATEDGAPSGEKDGEKRAKSDKPKNTMSAKEAVVMGILNDAGVGNRVLMNDVSKQSGFNVADTMGLLAALSRKDFLNLSVDGSMITEKGIEAFKGYIPPKRTQHADVRERPEGIGPKPTMVEFHEARLANAQATLAYTKVLQRMYPFNPEFQKKLDGTVLRIANIESDLERAHKGQPPLSTKERLAGGEEAADEARADQNQ